MKHSIESFEKIIGHVFSNKELILQALTHSSYSNEKRMNKRRNNERIEYLGDAVLELVVSDFLFKEYPEKNEGQLTKLRASLVCEYTLAICARDIELGKYIFLSKGEDKTGGRERDSILSDAFEAVIGALYLDGGFLVAQQFIKTHLLKDVENKSLFYDAKTILQEIVQAKGKSKIEYILLGESGPDHCKEFKVAIHVGEEEIAQGVGKTKKAAEQMAAYQAILSLKKEQ